MDKKQGSKKLPDYKQNSYIVGTGKARGLNAFGSQERKRRGDGYGWSFNVSNGQFGDPEPIGGRKEDHLLDKEYPNSILLDKKTSAD